MCSPRMRAVASIGGSLTALPGNTDPPGGERLVRRPFPVSPTRFTRRFSNATIGAPSRHLSYRLMPMDPVRATNVPSWRARSSPQLTLERGPLAFVQLPTDQRDIDGDDCVPLEAAQITGMCTAIRVPASAT